jgi:glycosyltransferase involved in cell wall biosynthesis
VPNGVDANVFNTEGKISVGKNRASFFTIGHSTDYTVFKGTLNFLKSLPGLLKKTRQFRVLISESITDDKVKQKYCNFVQKNELSKYVHFVGNLTEKQLVRFYQKIDVFCYSGSHECAGGSTASLSVVEAQACGTPVIRSVGNNDEIVHRVTGYMVNPTDYKAVSNQIAEFFRLSYRAKRMFQKNARNHVCKNFNWKQSSEAINALISKFQGDI